MSARWSLHSPTFFEDGVLKVKGGRGGGGALFRGLPLLFMRRVWCGIKDELVDGGGTRGVTVQGFTASLSDCLIEFNPLSKVSFFYLERSPVPTAASAKSSILPDWGDN